MALQSMRCKECGKSFIVAIEPGEIGRIVLTCPECGSPKLWKEERKTKRQKTDERPAPSVGPASSKNGEEGSGRRK